MKYLLLAIVLQIYLLGYSQTSFQKRIISTQTVQTFNAVELPNEDILLVMIKQNINSIYYPYYMILDKEGVVKTEIYDTAFNIMPMPKDIIMNDTDMVFIGLQNDSIIFTRRDFSLNQLSRTCIYFSDSIWGTSFYNYIIKDSLVIISGEATKYKYDVVGGKYTFPFIMKFDRDFNLINKNMGLSFTPDNFSGSFNNVVLDNNGKLTGCVFSASIGKMGRVTFNDTLGVDNILSLKYPIGNHASINYSPVLEQYYIFSRVNSNKNFKDVILGIYNYQFDTITHLNFGGATPAPFNDTNNITTYSSNSIAIKYKSIYIGGTYNKNPFSGFVGYDSWYMIARIGSDNEYVWKKRFGGDGSYNLINICSSKDGGCIANGIYFDHSNPPQSNIFLIKIDSNGISTWLKNINLPKVAVNIYPNPATTEINISLKQANEQIARLSIIDIQGKVVLQKQVDDKQTKLDVSALAKGVYIVEGYTSKGKGFNGKFVRE